MELLPKRRLRRLANTDCLNRYAKVLLELSHIFELIDITQKMPQLELVSFIPDAGSYQIWHPKDFIINESEDGIVTITSPATNSNLTITSYQASEHVTEQILIDFFQHSAKSYIPISEIKSSFNQNRIWLGAEFKTDKAFWTWWTLSMENQIILVSINSEEKLTDSHRHLYTFMIDKMEIYPDEFEKE